MEQYNKLLESAITALDRAVNQLEQNTVPSTPMPRHRVFHITHNIVWPVAWDGKPSWKTIYFEASKKSCSIEYECKTVASNIAKSCGYQPRKILAVLRRLQAATAWCEARAEGRRRMAEEILRQQAGAVEALSAEAAMLALK
jgi:hypothetical protein